MTRLSSTDSYTRPVKKLLCVLLLLLLPFQAGWALAAGYCEHRGAAHEQHFGHHDGHHHGYTADEDAAGNQAQGKANAGVADDGDATHCHGFGLAVLRVDASVPGPLAAAPTLHLAHTDWRAHIPAPPERPQWVRHA